MTTQIIGRVMMAFKGNYDATKQYDFLDTVTYNGSSYVCLVNGTTTAPSDISSNWQLMAKAGTTPDTSQFALKSELPDLTSYAKKSELPTVPTDLVHTSDLQTVSETASEALDKANSNAKTLMVKANKSDIPTTMAWDSITDKPNLVTKDDIPKTVKGDRGRSVWSTSAKWSSSNDEAGSAWITDLCNASSDNLPEVDDLIIGSTGLVRVITSVTLDSSEHFGVFNAGKPIANLQGPKGDSGGDAMHQVQIVTSGQLADLTTGTYEIDFSPEDAPTADWGLLQVSVGKHYAQQTFVNTGSPSRAGQTWIRTRNYDQSSYNSWQAVAIPSTTNWLKDGVTFLNGNNGNIYYRLTTIGNFHLVEVKGTMNLNLKQYAITPVMKIPLFGFETNDNMSFSGGSTISINTPVAFMAGNPGEFKVYSASTISNSYCEVHAQWTYVG